MGNRFYDLVIHRNEIVLSFIWKLESQVQNGIALFKNQDVITKYILVIEGEQPTIYLLYLNMPDGVLLSNYKGK